MPEISRFYGIIIRMYGGDHPPAHLHAIYGEHEALIDIGSVEVIRGRLPLRARRLVYEWVRLHQDELHDAWERARRLEQPGKIEPLP